MSDLWIDHLLQDLPKGSLGTVVSLGRGGHGFITALPDEAVQHIVQLEPCPKHARKLERAAPSGRVVLAYAFGPTDQIGMLHDFTMTPRASLRRATGLSTLFPGLRQTGSTEVEICSAATLMAQVDLHDTYPNLLILGAPGEEAEAITQFADLGALNRFDYVITPLPRLALYEDGPDGKELITKLETNGFRILQRDETDPDQPLALLQRDHIWAGLIAERDALRDDIDAAQARARDAILQANLTELQDKYAALLAEKQKLDDFLRETEQRLAALCEPDETASQDRS